MAGYGSQGITLQDALREAERAAVKLGDTNIDAVLAVARDEIVFPELAVLWEDAGETETGDILFPYRKVAALLIDNSVEPQAVGHALVWASFGGHIHCLRKLREIQVDEVLTASILTARFTTYAILKAAEAGHVEVMRELLKPIGAGSFGFMGYVVTKNYADNGYPFVNLPLGNASEDWLQRLASCKAMLPAAVPSLKSSEWDLQRLQGSDSVQQAIRASFGTYFLWRTALVAAANNHDEVLKELLKQRQVENLLLAESFRDGAGKNGYDVEVKKIISSRDRIDTLMYQLVEELSTRQYHDAILHALWSHIQKGGRESPRATASRSRSVAQAQNGLWELQLEKPLLRMSVEECYKEDEPFRRYKQLTVLFNQRTKVNVQLVAAVEALPTHLQVTVGIKHVRFKVENSRWDDKRMGHFPSLVSLSVRPETTEGTGVTMSNSSVNQSFKVGKAERIQAGVGLAGGAKGVRGNVGISAGVAMSTTVKNTPWRFEQLPMYQDRGGAFAWTLEAMKGQDFNRLNPPRMAETTSLWRFGKRIPGNPLSQLPFTSEGGIIFTSAKFDDTLIWRFPKSMEGTKLKWRIEGHFHCTYTSPRYWETRVQSFAGDIEETLVALEVKDKKDKDGGDEKKDKKDKKDKDGGDEKKDKKDKKDKDGCDEKKDKKDKKDKDGGDEKKDKKDKDGDDEKGDGKAEKEKKKKEEDDSVDGDEKAEKKKEKKAKVGADENVDGEEITKTKKEKKSEEGDDTVDNTEQKVEKKKKKKKTEDVDTKYAEYLEFLEWRKKSGKVEHEEDNVKPVKEKKEKKSKGAGDLGADAISVNQGEEKKVEADHIPIGNPNDHFDETAQKKETEVVSSQLGDLIDFGDDIPAKEKEKTVKVDNNVSPNKNVPEVQGGEEVDMAASSSWHRDIAVTVETRDMTFSSQDSQFQVLDAMGGLKGNSWIGRETQSYVLKKPPGWKAKVAGEEGLDQEGAQLKREEDSSSWSQRPSLRKPPGISVRTRSRDFRFDNF